jgi:hypothetical protein
VQCLHDSLLTDCVSGAFLTPVMVILAAGNNGGYDSIPTEEQDVTPVDRTITSRKQKTFKCVVIASCIVIVGVIAFLIWYERRPQEEVSVYETSILSQSGMKQVMLDEMLTSAFSPGKLNFGNVQCQPDLDEIICTNMPPNPAFIKVLPDEKYQTVVGFGGAFTEASAVNFYLLPKDVQAKILDMYFGENGNGYTLGRIHINSCDFSLGSYSFDNSPGDTELQFFDNRVSHDGVYVLPLIKAAIAKSRRPIKILASPWSPPAWMKEPNDEGEQSMTGSAFPNGLKDDPEIKHAWARYISKFISAYIAQGVDVWSVTPQNEPEFPAPWEACAFTASYEDDFVQNYLGPVLREEHPDVLILGFDHNKDHLEAWTKELLQQREGESRYKYIDGMAFHCKFTANTVLQHWVVCGH